jgi:hypothetical protein
VHPHLLADTSVQGCGHGWSGRRLQHFPKFCIILYFAWVWNEHILLILQIPKKLTASYSSKHNKMISYRIIMFDTAYCLS